MELEGRLNPALSLPEVLQFLSMGKMTGTLTIVQGSYTVSLVLRAGKLVNSSSIGRPRKLGQMLLSRGHVQRAALEEVLQYQKKQTAQTPLGQLLIDRHLITNDQLRQAIRLQLEEEMWDLFALEEGSFKFEHGDENSMGPPVVELDVEPLILEGTRRLDEWQRIVKNVPGDSSIPVPNPVTAATDRDAMHFSEAEWRVLSLVNGFYNVGSIASRSGVGRFETYRILNSFLASGHIIIRPAESKDGKLTDGRASSGALRRSNGSASQSGDRSGGSASAWLLTMFAKKKAGEPSSDVSVQRDTSALDFASPVTFVAGLGNAIIEELFSNPDFTIGAGDEHLAEHYWKNILMSYPKADLVSADGNQLTTGQFDRYVEFTGLEGGFRSCYEDTLEALGRFLKMLFLLAAQRLGMKMAQRIFSVVFDNYRRRSTIRHGEDFSLQDYAAKVYG